MFESSFVVVEEGEAESIVLGLTPTLESRILESFQQLVCNPRNLSYFFDGCQETPEIRKRCYLSYL
jgi:hypothetical protein